MLGLVLATLYIPDLRGEVRVALRRTRLRPLRPSGSPCFMTGSTTLGLALLPRPLVLVMLFAGALPARRLCPAQPAGGEPDHRPVALRHPDLPPEHDRRAPLPARRRRHALPAAAPPAGRLRHVAVPVGHDHLRRGGRRHRDEVRRAAAPPPPRLPHRPRRSTPWSPAAFVAMPAAFTPATPIGLMTGLLLIGGFFRSLQFTSVNALAFADMPPARMSRATTLTSVAQQLSLSLGISVGAVTLETDDALHRRRDRRRIVLAGVPRRRRPLAALGDPFLPARRATPATRCPAAGALAPDPVTRRCASAADQAPLAPRKALGDEVELDRLRPGSPAA